MTDGQGSGLVPTPSEHPDDLTHRFRCTGKHYRGGPVHRCDVHTVAFDKQPTYLVLGSRHRHHHAAGGQRMHQLGTRAHQPGSVLQRQHPRHVCGGDLAHRVPTDQVRAHSPRLEQPEQRDLEGEQRRLRPPGPGQFGPTGEHHVLQSRTQQFARRVVGGGEHGKGLVQLVSHPGTLGTLSGEQHAQPIGRATSHDSQCRFAGGQRRHTTQQIVTTRAQDHAPVLEPGPPGHQCEADIGRGQLRVDCHMGQQTLRLVPQRLLRPGRQHPWDDRHHRRCGRGGPHLWPRRLLQNDVCIRPACPESGDTRPARLAGLRPRLCLPQRLHRARGPVDTAGRSL